MSEASRHRRLYVNNRLEELRAKYGHETEWITGSQYLEDYEDALARLQSEPAGAVSNGGEEATRTEPLPASQKSLITGVVTHPVAAPANALVDTLDL